MSSTGMVPRGRGRGFVVSALAFLVSDDADFITGQILHVDGGVTRMGA
ncbi:SDR family oxidoreductase [Microbispora siamensis]